jgi:G:T/U-mismatch repair DNA glycosylase
MRRLSRAEEDAGQGRSVPDLITENLGLLLVGINPSLSSGATGYHFATATNRLWPALYGAGLTKRLLEPNSVVIDDAHAALAILSADRIWGQQRGAWSS